MDRTVRSHRLSHVVLIGLTLMMASIATTGYADLAPTERLSGPALVGTLVLSQSGTDAAVIFTGKCRGDDVLVTTTLPGLTIATMTATSLEGLRLPGAGPFGCLFKDAAGGDLIVNTVVPPKFANNGIAITADAVLLYVIPL